MHTHEQGYHYIILTTVTLRNKLPFPPQHTGWHTTARQWCFVVFEIIRLLPFSNIEIDFLLSPWQSVGKGAIETVNFVGQLGQVAGDAAQEQIRVHGDNLRYVFLLRVQNVQLVTEHQRKLNIFSCSKLPIVAHCIFLAHSHMHQKAFLTFLLNHVQAWDCVSLARSEVTGEEAS